MTAVPATGSRLWARVALVSLVAGSGAAGTAVALPTATRAAAALEVQVPTPDSAPLGVTVGPDGHAWFVENTGFVVGRVQSTHGAKEFAVPPSAPGRMGSLDSITTGSDGALWFTDDAPAAPRIGRIDPVSDAVTMFALPSGPGQPFSGAQPLEITAGPDGALWFTTFRGGSIGRIDTLGAVKAYPVPGGGATRAITVGPDGAIWFTQSSPDAVGRLDPSAGKFTMHLLRSGSGNLGPAGIATGSDGAIWFAESQASVLGRIDPTSGALTTIATPTPHSMPLGMTAASDGGVWFTEAAAGNVGRVDVTSRQVVEHPLSSALDGPTRIAAGPGGALWVAETGVDRIAQLSAMSPPAGAANVPVAIEVPASVPAAFEDQCPLPHVCMTQVATGGLLRVKNFVQKVPRGAIRITGFILPPANPDGSFTLQAPLTGQELDSTPMPVPGGLLGTFPTLGPILAPIVGPIVGPLNDLSISLSLAGPIHLFLGGTLSATVPVTLHLNNPILGADCTITPVVQHLVITATGAGAGDPQLGWRPEPVNAGDSTFSVPAATGCGGALLSTLVDPVVNSTIGLPSAAGNNAALLHSVLSLGAGLHS